MSLEQIISTAYELIPSDLLDDFLEGFYKSNSESNLKNTQRDLLKTLAYEISLGCNNENINKSIEILDMIVSYDNSLEEVIRASIKNNSFPSKYNIKLYEHFNESFNINLLEHHITNNLSEEIFEYQFEKLNKNTLEKLSEKELIELFKIFIEDDIEEFIKASLNDNKESALKSIRCAIRCEAIEIFKYLISRFPIDSFDNAIIAKYIAHPMIEVGNISMLQYLFDSKFQFLEYMNADLNNCQHYKFVEIFKTQYETESVVALRYTVSMIYSKLYNIKLYSLI